MSRNLRRKITTRDTDKSYREYLQKLLTFPHNPIQSVFVVNKNRHYVVRTRYDEYWCLIRWQGFFRKFGVIFLRWSEPGESINKTELQKACRANATLIFSYPDPKGFMGYKSYYIDASRFHDIAEEGNFYRKTFRGEETASIPFRELQTFGTSIFG